MFDPSSAAVWLGWADRAYVGARLLWFAGLQLESPVYGHRALELYLKTLLVSYGDTVASGRPAWGHRLPTLAEAAARHDASFGDSDLVRRLAFFERYFQHVRYPSEPGSPDDGSLVWFSFDANICPLDECVAYIRPRVVLNEDFWKQSYLATLLERASGFDHRALVDSNSQLGTVVCSASSAAEVTFNSAFKYDLPGC